jgi:hypothetical protein
MTDLGPLPSSDEGTKRQVLTTRRATLLAMSEVPLCPSKRTGIAAVISRSSMGWQKTSGSHVSARLGRHSLGARRRDRNAFLAVVRWRDAGSAAQSSDHDHAHVDADGRQDGRHGPGGLAFSLDCGEPTGRPDVERSRCGRSARARPLP